jgi:AcrR family transcriptional regulator
MARGKSIGAETRKQNTRAALRAAMLTLLIEKPFDQIQILDVTRLANVGYATFFRHYGGTEDVLHEIAGDQIRQLLAMTIPVLEQYDSSVSMRALCQYVFEQRSLWCPLLTGGAAHTVRSEFVRQAREWSRKATGAKPSVPVDLGTVCAAGSTIDALAWWLDQNDAYSIDEMAQFVDRLIIKPFIGDRKPSAAAP